MVNQFFPFQYKYDLIEVCKDLSFFPPADTCNIKKEGLLQPVAKTFRGAQPGSRKC
jgi:hypothetical protein